MSRRITFAIVLVLSTFLCVSNSSAQTIHRRSSDYRKGKIDATQDIKRNIYVVKGYGLPFFNNYPWPSPEDIYQSILKEKYNITIKLIGGCVVDDKTRDYIVGYDDVSIAAMESKWGTGLLDTVREQANVEYHEKYGDMQREYDKTLLEGLKLPAKKNPQ
jgi:hypothetical protein